MNLKDKIREALLKEQPRKYDYGCVMIYLRVKEEDWKKLQEMVDEKDIYFGEDGEGFGREMHPHATILYGIHADVPDADVEKKISQINDPEIQLKDVSSFNNEKFDVLKFDINSKDLVALNKSFKELPHTSEYPDYHAHATICYLKPGLAKKYIPKFSDVDLKVDTEKIVYSKPDGVKKDYPL